MGVMATERFYCSHKWASSSRTSGLVGALLFIVSDTILAYNKFVSPLPMAKVMVMVTYYAGQYFIARTTDQPLVMDKPE